MLPEGDRMIETCRCVLSVLMWILDYYRLYMCICRCVTEIKVYMFRTVTLSIISSFSLYTQQWYMSYMSADSLRAGAGRASCSCSQAVWHIPLMCVQWKTPDDGKRNSPKHIDFYSKIEFEKLVHLVCFIVRAQRDMAKLIVYVQKFTNAPNKVLQRLHFTHMVHRRHLNVAKVSVTIVSFPVTFNIATVHKTVWLLCQA